MKTSSLKFAPEALGHLMADRFLSIPAYQRPYAWEESHVADFWNDLDDARRDGREYFIGAIVMTPALPSRHYVIDGQQRLVTASLLLAAIRDELASLGEHDVASHVEERYLRSYDRQSRDVVPRLLLPESDAEFFVDRFLTRSGGEPRSASQRRMLGAFDAIRATIASVEVDQAKSIRVGALNDWLDHLEEAVIVVVVDAATNADAFQIFETLNDRGAPLTIADLLKNYLMSLDPSNTDEIRSSWDLALLNLGTDIETRTFVTFVRHYWNSTHGATRERDLYKSLRETVTSGESALDFARNLGSASESYAAMLDPRHSRWADVDVVIPRAIETLLLFQLGQYRPLLMAAIELLSDSQTISLAESLVCWSFRGIVVGGIGGGTSERAYAQAAIRVRDGRATTVEDVYRQLRPNIPSDNDFRSALETATLRRARLAHYVMRAIDRMRSGEPHPALEPFPPDRRAAVSTPVLPRDADVHEYRSFAADSIADSASRVGNLALRPPGRQSIPTAWSERRQWLSSHGFAVNDDIEDHESWSPNAIRYRQQEMASLAVAIWPREPA